MPLFFGGCSFFLGDPEPAFLIRLSIASVPEGGEGDAAIEEFVREAMPTILKSL